MIISQTFLLLLLIELKTGFCPSCFYLPTSDALVTNLRATSTLITNQLTESHYQFVLPNRFQSDSNERNFSKYCQMRSGSFLLALKEVNTSVMI